MQFDPELQARIDQLVIETGYAAEKLAEDAMAGYVAELAATREMLDSCYDHLKIGRVKPVPRDELVSHFREKSGSTLTGRRLRFIVVRGLSP